MRCFRILLVLCLLMLGADAVLAATLHGTIYDIELNELDNVIVEVDSEPNQRFVSKDGVYSFRLSPGDYVLTANYTKDGLYRYSVTENVSIDAEGDFVYDLFLFPGFDEDEDDFIVTDPDEELSETIFDENGANRDLLLGVVIALVLVVLVLLYILFGRARKKAEKEEIKAVSDLQKHDKELIPVAARKKEKKERKEKKHKMSGEGVKAEEQAHPAHAELEDDLQQIVDIMKKEGGRTTQKELRKQIPLSEAKISLMVSELEHKGVVEKVKKGRGNIIILKKSH